MRPKKIAILHFNVIEKYPPVMNFIYDAIEANPAVQILVFTTKNTTTYQTPKFPNSTIYRFGKVSSNRLVRYFSYIYYNLFSSCILLYNKVDLITAFETISIFPLWFKILIKPKAKAHIHFHEYLSMPERMVGSAYMKFLFKLENKLLVKFSCSHTNEDRKKLFLEDNPQLNPDKVEVRPNMPPSSWWNNFGKCKKPSSDGKLRLVYVGTCDNNTMYIKEILDWVSANQNSLELTFISQEIPKATNDLIISYNCPVLKIIPPIDYYQLPQELVKYDIGLVLYKGHIPNYVYNVPNKVYEYLACGLGVITSNQLTSTVNLNQKKIKAVDFSKLNDEVLRVHIESF
jgi:hypothetical protein